MSVNYGEVNDGFPVVPSFWHKLSSEESNNVLFDFSRLLLDRLSESGWVAAGLDILASITSNDLRSLCYDDRHDAIMGLSADDQFIVRQCLALFSKREDLDIGIDRKRVATEKFIAAEQLCRETNALFRAWSQGRLQFSPRVEQVLHLAQYKIAKLLGECPSLDAVRLRFGPGATTATPKKNACPVVKLKSGIQCSTNFPVDDVLSKPEYFNPAVDQDKNDVEVAIHLSKVEFVPKNAKTYRAICVEPMFNSMHQNGLGDLLAARLRRVGIDIADQSANQRAALYGSISGESATLDLSSASDTVSVGLVKHLFPDTWSDLLLSLSTREGVVDGKMTVFEKLSSMGNGFTFPVETIVFWALAQAAKDVIAPNHRYRVLVYGDDIIIPTSAVPLLREVLRCCGFLLNSSKSFWEGPFRESCGCDYVLGQSVRPIFVSDALEGADFFRLRNFFHARGDSLATFWESRIDPSARLYGPSGYGDGHLHSEVFPVIRKDHWGADMGAMFETYGRKPKSLDRRVVERLAEVVSYRPMEWDGDTRRWVRSRNKIRFHSFHEKYYGLVRKLATYTAMRAEDRVLILTPSDALRSRGTHVYSDRRMPDPQPGNEGIFTTPGDGARIKQRVYIFKTA